MFFGKALRFLARHLELVVLAAIVIAVLVLNQRFGLVEMVSSGRLFDMVEALLYAHPIEAVLLYVAISVFACVALFVPVAVPAVAGGLIFGAFWGTVFCWVSVVIGACAGFFISRFLLKDAIKPFLTKNEKIRKILFEGVGKRDVQLLALTRLTPVLPFNIQNFAYGVTDIRFAPYILYSALFLLPGTAVYSLGSAGLFGSENPLLCFYVAGVLLAVSLVAAVLLKRRDNS